MIKSICIFLIFILYLCACSSNKYERVPFNESKQFKKVELPFSKATSFFISQGAFGKDSHNEKGNEYSWDFAVPYGTKVMAIEAGMT